MRAGRRGLGLIALVLVTLAWPTIATSSPSDDAPHGPQVHTAAGQGAGFDDAAATAVTLITGDVVSVVDPEADEPTYVITPAPGTEGDGTTFSISGTPEATYIVPSDVAELVGPDAVLDPELFNVQRLVAEGLDDANGDALPIIVQRADGAEPIGVPGVRTDDRLDVLDAYSADLDKAATTALGRRLAAADVPAGQTALSDAGAHLNGVRRIWLDGETQAQEWDVNLRQVGAPELWAAGVTGDGVTVAVLDTGIDLDHPDLADQVIASANFSAAPALDDIAGHGTHVAGTIAGTGALAPGVRQGVAPDADLLIGKVLGDDGRGSMSDGIAGMEWAVDNGADIVNMSLSSIPTDGTDPMSLALNELSRTSGALFVTAAGNDGPSASSVASPSTADLALSVAAVDAAGDVARFSSRGPRVGDDGIKPEIAAPGVDIVAPRSSAMPGDDAPYTTMSGTSMATPHVAGIAALLAQQRQDWDAARLKSALVSTARAASGGVFAVGSGQVSGPAVLGATLVPDEATIGVTMTDDDVVATKQVVVTNTADTGITASTSVDGSTDGVLSVTPTSIDLEAGESETVTLTVDGAALSATNGVTGQLAIVPDTGTTLRLPVAVTRTRWLEVTTLRSNGDRAARTAVNVLNFVTGETDSVRTSDDGVAHVSTSDGAAAVTATIRERAEDGTEIVSIVTTDVDDGADEVTLDASTAVPVGAQVRHKTRQEFGLYRVTRHNAETGAFIYNSMMSGGAFGVIEPGSLRVSPTTDQLHSNTFRLDEHWILANRDSDNNVGDATTVYDLVFSSESVATDAVHRLTRADVKALAREEIDFFAPAAPHRSQFATLATGPDLVGITVTSPSYVATPVHQTRYFTPGDVTWEQLTYRAVRAPEGWVRMDLAPHSIEYESGQRSSTSFWAGPLGASASVGLVETVDGTTRLGGSVVEMVDAAGHPGTYRDIFYDQPGERSSRIFRDGELVAETLPEDGVEVDPSPARYTLEQGYHGAGLWPIGGDIATRWETEPVGLADANEIALPLLQARWQAPDLDLTNTAPAAKRIRLDVLLTSTALDEADREIMDATASFTTDGGQTWQPMTPKRGKPIVALHRFAIPDGALSPGDWVGVRVTARDQAGNTMEQEMLQAFPVR